MEKFDEEKYSREVYDAARRDSGATWEETRGPGETKRMREIRRKRWDDFREAKKRVEKLYAKGQEEAAALNEEYNRLHNQAQEAIEEYNRAQTRAEKAMEAITDFEREKLVMHEQDLDSPK